MKKIISDDNEQARPALPKIMSITTSGFLHDVKSSINVQNKDFYQPRRLERGLRRSWNNDSDSNAERETEGDNRRESPIEANEDRSDSGSNDADESSSQGEPMSDGSESDELSTGGDDTSDSDEEDHLNYIR